MTMPMWLEPFIQDWKPNFFWAIIVGIPIALFLDFVGRKKRRLEYQMTSTVLLSPDMSQIPGVQITVDSQPVEKLTSTSITFTNIGNQRIEENDFATLAPLGFSVKDGHFLQHTFETVSDNDKMNLRIERVDAENAHISFEFIRPTESFSVTVLHDGALSVCGELKDGKIQEHKKPFPILRKFAFKTLQSFLMLIYGSLTQWGLLYLIFDKNNILNSDNTTEVAIALLIIALITLFLPVILWHTSQVLAYGILETITSLIELYRRLRKKFFK